MMIGFEQSECNENSIMSAGRQLQVKKLFALTLIAASLVACGGGGGSGPDSVTPGQGDGGTNGNGSVVQPSATPATIEFISSSSGDTTSPDDAMIIRPTSVGGITQTTLSFLVKDANGAPVANQTVNFSIETEGTGLTLLSSQPVTDKDGIAKVIVKAGDISTATSIK
ncbi:Ig-like domain-containing protein, partial [Craterilacuibacter sp.]|uniref:Ig-like domain-containing protein n=1 Tax=Craterilacuibacter sp. TaxID=2870909 RepID=UPI003F2CEE0F